MVKGLLAFSKNIWLGVKKCWLLLSTAVNWWVLILLFTVLQKHIAFLFSRLPKKIVIQSPTDVVMDFLLSFNNFLTNKVDYIVYYMGPKLFFNAISKTVPHTTRLTPNIKLTRPGRFLGTYIFACLTCLDFADLVQIVLARKHWPVIDHLPKYAAHTPHVQRLWVTLWLRWQDYDRWGALHIIHSLLGTFKIFPVQGPSIFAHFEFSC